MHGLSLCAQAIKISHAQELLETQTLSGFNAYIQGLIQQAQEKIGIADLMFLAYHAMKRESAGKPVKPFDVWCETVADVSTGDNDPKATSAEV
jgi:ERCC4-related helicase